MASPPVTTARPLDADSVVAYLAGRGIVPADAELAVEELAGGVSSPVLAVRGEGIALVVKQALPRLRVAEEWHAPARRTDTEAAALRLAGRLLPGRVPAVVDSDGDEHVVVMQHAPAGWRNWQSEILAGRVHAAGGRLGRRHARAPARRDRGRCRGGGGVRRPRGLRAAAAAIRTTRR